MYPEASESVLDEDHIQAVTKQLLTIGFSTPQVRSATNFMSQKSPLAASLLSASAPLEACIEYLVLHLPESDLPKRFLPDKNSSTPFVTSGQSGSRDLKRVWLESKAIKEAGWPVYVVKEVLADDSVDDWESLVVSLGRKLIGLEARSTSVHPQDPYTIDEGEAEAMGADCTETALVMPLFSAPLSLHVSVSTQKRYPRSDFCPMYLSSSSIPAYVRLHLISCLLLEIQGDDFMQPAEGFCMACMRILENEWQNIEDNGRPNVSTVLQYILPQTKQLAAMPAAPSDTNPSHRNAPKQKRSNPFLDDRTDLKVRQDFERLTLEPKVNFLTTLFLCPYSHINQYVDMLSHRRKLPAFAAREDFLALLAANRVVVVVGETGTVSMNLGIQRH
jgi:hypothetical protein